MTIQQLGGAPFADDRQLHYVSGSVLCQRLRQHVYQVVEEVTAPVVKRTVRGGLLEGVDRHLIEARDDHVVALLGHPRVQILRRRRHAVSDPIAKRVRERVLDRRLVDVDRVHVGGAVAGQLHGQHPLAAADVQAPLVGADAFAVQVLPDQQAALGRLEHARTRHRSRARRAGRGCVPRASFQSDGTSVLKRAGARSPTAASPGARDRVWCRSSARGPPPGARGARHSSRR